MSVAALEALTLRRHLDRGIELQPRRWFRDLARVVDVPWDLSAGGDLAVPGVPGTRTLKGRLLGGYLNRLHAAAANDATSPPLSCESPDWSHHPRHCSAPPNILRVFWGGAVGGCRPRSPRARLGNLTPRTFLPAAD